MDSSPKGAGSQSDDPDARGVKQRGILAGSFNPDLTRCGYAGFPAEYGVYTETCFHTHVCGSILENHGMYNFPTSVAVM